MPGMFQHTARFIYVTTMVQFIVTAAIHWGLSSALLPPCGRMTPPLDLPALGRCQSLYLLMRSSQRPVFLLNSQLTLFTVGRRGLHPNDHPLSRSYGASLPSSLTGVLSNAWEYSSRLPVSDCGTGTIETPNDDFSRQCSLNQFASAVASAPHFPHPALRQSYRSEPGRPTPGWPSFLRPRRPSNAP